MNIDNQAAACIGKDIPSITMITIVLNGEAHIVETMKSVLSQDYGDIEYIIVDGGSTDGTLKLVEQYRSSNVKVISGPDQGIYDAINKGIALANGEIIGLIHSGDTLVPGALKRVAAAFRSSSAEIVYGDANVVGDLGGASTHRIWRGDHRRLNRKMSVPHPSTFIHRTLYQRLGTYDNSFRSAADYDLLLKAYMAGFSFARVDATLSNFREGGISGSNFKLSLTENIKIRANHIGVISAALYGMRTTAIHATLTLRRAALKKVLGPARWANWKLFYRSPLQDKFCLAYSSIKDSRPFLSRLRFYSALRLSIRIVANLLLPMYFIATRPQPRSKHLATTPNLVVSLTSFPSRIGRLWIVVECILRQSRPPDEIVLWLSREQFASVDELPRRLRLLTARGLTIRLVDRDVRSHKKYAYALNHFPSSNIVTIDDDIIYISSALQSLIDASSTSPGSICCHRASYIETSGTSVQPYLEWRPVHGRSQGDSNLFFTSGAGTLFPPGSLHPDATNLELATALAPYADDVWLNIMSRLAGTRVIKTDLDPPLLPVLHLRSPKLHAQNVARHGNDRQMTAVLRHYSVDGSLWSS